MIQRGIYTPVPTFFKKDLKTIDFETQAQHAQFLKDNGISGIIVMGSTGELGHLTREERAQVVSHIHKSVPDFPIFGGGLIDWFIEVADRSELPVLVYIYPGVTNNVVVEPSTVVTLSKHPNIVGTKISHGDVAHHAAIGLDPSVKAGQFTCLTGLGQILLPALTVGFDGTVDALSGAFPKLYVNILNSYDSGDIGTAQRLQWIATRGEELVVRFGVVGIKRAIQQATGFGETYLGRAPLNQDVVGWEQYEEYFTGCTDAEKML
ncbi:hypothetical protein CJI97_002173 [Candidozyma auris]|nr:hypothetical protein CJI97_002173 [[Candida] auris]